MKIPKTNYAFIDGSYNQKTKVYGYGGFLVDAIGLKHTLMGSGNDPDMAKMRNVAGEIMGAKAAVKLASELGLKRLTIFHDYMGISMWPLGKWKCKNKFTKEYAEYIWKIMVDSGLKIVFTHVQAHSGIDGNEEADKLAKMAVGLSKVIKEAVAS